MLITDKTTNQTTEMESQIPLVLGLNAYGQALRWLSIEDCAYYKSKGKILWTLGEHELTLRGGTNAKTGLQSRLVIDTIVALDSDKNPEKFRSGVPTLTNTALFARDRHICGYCGSSKRQNMTRDHILAVSKGGKDTWQNTVCSCISCNNYKGDKTLEQAGMELLFLPYVPSMSEFLILQNRKILFDQMEFLMKNVPKNSRLYQ